MINDTVLLNVRIELLSDTIFGVGFSIPGAEDISIRTDNEGHPYLMGATFKGLLRESLEDLLVWSGGDSETLNDLLGQDEWWGSINPKRLRLSDFRLSENDMKQPVENLTVMRTFTQIDNGVTKEGSLRTARCIQRGLIFTGEIHCLRGDSELISKALRGIKWLGTMRSRGFGHVKITADAVSFKKPTVACQRHTSCIRYKIHLDTPLRITWLSASYSTGYETRNYLPGSAVRGMVLGELSRHYPDYFNSNKKCLLSMRFLNAIPLYEEINGIPSPKGFYEDKKDDNFENMLVRGEIIPGNKRAKLGSFCSPENGIIRYWSPETGGSMRINLKMQRSDEVNKGGLFQCRWIAAGQELEGYIFTDDQIMTDTVAAVFKDQIWLGASQYSGYGKCSVKLFESVDEPLFMQYGYKSSDTIDNTLYMELLSPTVMRGENSEYCGIDEKALARLLDVESATIEACDTALFEAGGYNRTWGCRMPAVTMYDSGSMFKIKTSESPLWIKLRQTELRGIGIRREEGYGQVLFLKDFEFLNSKQDMQKHEQIVIPISLNTKCKEYISKNPFRTSLSPSQVGTIQSYCYDKDTGWENLEKHLEFNLTGRGSDMEYKYRTAAQYIREFMNKPLSETLGTECEDSIEMKLKILSKVIDYSRKVVEKE